MPDLAELDVFELDGKFLVLQPDAALAELRIVNVERFRPIQHHDQMVAVGRDLVMVPLIGNELVLAIGLTGADNRTGAANCCTSAPTTR